MANPKKHRVDLHVYVTPENFLLLNAELADATGKIPYGASSEFINRLLSIHFSKKAVQNGTN